MPQEELEEGTNLKEAEALTGLLQEGAEADNNQGKEQDAFMTGGKREELLLDIAMDATNLGIHGLTAGQDLEMQSQSS